MLDLNLYHNSTKVVSCILFDVDAHLTLDFLRNKIKEEVANLMPTDYMFVVLEKPVKLSEEQTKTINTSIQWEKNEPFIHYTESKTGVAKSETTKSKEEHPPAHTTRKDCVTTVEKATDALAMLQSPTTCSIKGIKIYSEDEIEKGIGKEKERRRFWNKKARELCKANIKKQDLYSRIHDEWRAHKASSMTKEAKRNEGKEKSTLKKGTLMGNIARVDQAKQKLEDLLKEIKKEENSCCIEKSKKVKRLREELQATRSEIRKAQDALRKSNAKLK